MMPLISTVIKPSYPGKAPGEYLNSKAFAAIRADGSVVSWGDPSSGGDSSSVASKLDGTIDATQVFSTSSAFAALLINGSLSTWGTASSGGDSSSVASKLDGTIDVTQVFSTSSAFAALRADGSVVTWGLPAYGGDSSTVASKLDGTIDVTQISSTGSAFAAIRADGSVVTWGLSSYGGDSSTVASKLDGTNDVTQIFSTLYAFAALRSDGSLVTWGSSSGGNSSSVASKLDGTVDVIQVVSSGTAFAALRADGSVVTWGSSLSGGDSSAVASELDGAIDITQISSTSSAFAALREDGSVVTWGHSWYGGSSSTVANKLDGTIDVSHIYSNSGAFAALRSDGSVVTWGDSSYGANSSTVANQLDGTIDVVNIFSTSFSFAALRADGTVVTWGAGISQTDTLNGASPIVSIASPFFDDRLVLLPPAPTIIGTLGNDTLLGTLGNDIIDGGAGTDTAVYTARMAAYTTSSTLISGPDGTDNLTSIERLHFTDAHLAFDTEGNAGQVYRLYKAAFARTPDLPGLGGWIGGMDNGMSLEAVANAFIGSGEFQSLYGANPSASDFVLLLYLNVLGRAPDAGGLDYWVNQIDSSLQTRAQVLAQFSESGENKNAVAAKIANGILYATADQTSIVTQGLDLVGTSGNDSLIGSVAKDILNGLAGDDTLNGGANVDTALYSGARSAYNITRTDTGLTVIGEGTDSLINIERLQFSDGGLAFDTSGNAGQVYRLYQAAFDRTPDTAGLSDWLRGMDNGMTLQKVATGFIGSGEFQDRYGANPTDAAFVDLLYQNVLNREPDAEGEAYWLDELDRGMTREMALIGFSESEENQVAVIGVIQDGISYIPG